ncbi:multicopper oxidase family protein [Zavarzinia sp.]|uniref:multicopper oxidase family protein n=1 Tax=Zavarzinia sp. TaxID=2027920 RepID=UPI00356AF739
MTLRLTRRGFVASAAAAAILPVAYRYSHAETPRFTLTAERRTIEVKGRSADVLGLRQADGRSGLFLDPGERFSLRLNNRIGAPTIIHWHGQTPPAAQDGVTDTGYATPIADGAAVDYDFAPRPGTHWMHSHHGLQEMRLLAAPLIVRRPEDQAEDRQEVTVLLHDFSFKAPEELLAGLGQGMMSHGMDMSMPGMDHSAMPGMGAMPGMNHGAGGDLNDIEFDAYLANDRTLDDPEVVKVEKGGRVLLRLINGSAATAYWLDLGALTGSVVAVDGNPVVPVMVSRLPFAQGQRVDIVLSLPAEGGAFPVLVQREGDRARTGIVLASPGATVAKVAGMAETAVPPADLSLEEKLRAATPLAEKAPDITRRIRLTGSMMPYVWTIDGRSWADRDPIKVTPGARVQVEIANESEMAHPMHLHGHHFAVVAIGGQKLAGAMRDTVLVPIGQSVTIAFDADNAGRWLFHCHNLLHMATGMMTEVAYS